MFPINHHLQNQLHKRDALGNRRVLKASVSTSIDFASNDYLGFIHERCLDTLVEKEMLAIGTQAKWGAGGSRLLTGHTQYCEDLEREIAQFHQAEAGLIFNSGYIANLGLLSAVISPSDTVICDQAVHASIHDALKSSRARSLPFRHGDLAHCARQLERASGNTFVCVDSVYSGDGSQANLRAFNQLCQHKGAHLIVDEAHATGWLGPKGTGAVQLHELQASVFARLHTFGKALGIQGAIVLGSSLLCDYLINFARPFIYTTALPLSSLIAIRCAYHALEASSLARQRLTDIIQYFRCKVKESALPVVPSYSPIQSFKIRGNRAVCSVAAALQKEGFDVRALMSPTVRRGEECLRICLHAFNTEEQIDALIKNIKRMFKQ